jgi:lysozyme family protein
VRDVFEQAYAITLDLEGNGKAHPADAGGDTSWGVIQATYDAYRDSRKRPRQSVYLMTKVEREDIYWQMYWQAAGCDFLAPRVAIAHFDAAVLPGLGAASRLLQAACGVEVDGKVGPMTLAAVRGMKEETLLEQMQAARRGYFIARSFIRPANRVFLQGWMNRTYRLLKALGVRIPRGAIA